MTEHPIPKTPSVQEAVAAVDTFQPAQQDKREDGVADTEDPKAQEIYEFAIDEKIGRREYKGRFKNKILTLEDKLRVGNVRSLLTNQAPWEALDPDTRLLSEIQAHLAISLQEKPRWFDSTKLHDSRILYRVYRRVQEHESFFRGSEASEEDSEVGA